MNKKENIETNQTPNVLVLTGQEAHSKVSAMIESAKGHVRIASPWITKTAFCSLFGAKQRETIRSGELKVSIIIRFSTAFDISCNSGLLDYVRELGVEIFVAKTIHAKTLIVDDREVITGSFNFTDAGFKSPEVRELGAWTDQAEAVKKSLGDFEKLKAAAKLLPQQIAAVVLAATANGYVVLTPVAKSRYAQKSTEDIEPAVGGKSDWGIDIESWKRRGTMLSIQRHGPMTADSMLEIIDVVSVVNSSKLDQELAMQAMYGKNDWNGGASLLPIALGTLPERDCYIIAKAVKGSDLFPLVNPGEFAYFSKGYDE